MLGKVESEERRVRVVEIYPVGHRAKLASSPTHRWRVAARNWHVQRGASDDVGHEKSCGPSGDYQKGPGLRGSSVTDRCGSAPSSRFAAGLPGRCPGRVHGKANAT